jgi:hypothetical protein
MRYTNTALRPAMGVKITGTLQPSIIIIFIFKICFYGLKFKALIDGAILSAGNSTCLCTS